MSKRVVSKTDKRVASGRPERKVLSAEQLRQVSGGVKKHIGNVKYNDFTVK